ncbi:MAG: hypothetical protein RLZZ453_395 [Chlamydiota bacterium]
MNIAPFLLRNTLGSQFYNVLQEGWRWCEKPKAQSVNKTLWAPTCQQALEECAFRDRIFLVGALVASVASLLFGSFFFRFFTLLMMVGGGLLKDGECVVKDVFQLHASSLFRGQIKSAESMDDRINLLLRNTLLLQQLPVHSVESLARVLTTV